MSRTRVGAPERETDNGKKHAETDATHNTKAMRCTCLQDMNECHTLTQQNDENPKDKEPEMEIDEAGDILYTQKGKYYIRGITREEFRSNIFVLKAYERVTKRFCNPRISIAKDPLRCNS